MPKTGITNSFIISNFERDGTTPLMLAAAGGRQFMVEFLVSMGADPKPENEVGQFLSFVQGNSADKQHLHSPK
jgi:ankyrin repeat protein